MDTWNTPAERPARKGMPTWGKVLLGCGIVSALAMGACVVGSVYVYKKGKTVIAEATREPMRELSLFVQESSPEALGAFYASHPGLAKRYPDVNAFTESMKDLTTRVGPIPTEITDFMTLLKERRLEMNAHKENGVKGMTLKYRNPGKESLVGVWEGGKLVDLKVE